MLGRALNKVLWHVRPLRSSGSLRNPIRRDHPRQSTLTRLLLAPITRLGVLAGFLNVDYSYLHGPPSRLHVGERCSLTNTTFNLASGDVWVGDDTLLSHGCYVLTGQHRFYNGKRASLNDAPFPEIPKTGRDIHIGSGCFIGANAMVLGGVTIGDNVIVAGGAVVTKDIPSGSFAAGIPAATRPL